MGKILSVLVMVMFLSSIAFATTVDNKISGNTVSFSTIDWANNRPPSIVTFNSVTRHIRLTNLSVTQDCYVDLRCVDSNGKRGQATLASATVLLPALGKASPNTVELDFATHNLGFVGKAIGASTNSAVSGSDQQVHYFVTGEQDL